MNRWLVALLLVLAAIIGAWSAWPRPQSPSQVTVTSESTAMVRSHPAPAQQPRPSGSLAASASATSAAVIADPAQIPAALRHADPRIRAAARHAARTLAPGDPAIHQLVEQLDADEPDPRVRAATTAETMPSFGEDLRTPALPAAQARAEPGKRYCSWKDTYGGSYSSTIQVDADGRANVETIGRDEDGVDWHLRYPAWAWHDAQGNLVIDARGQQATPLNPGGHGTWWPDSLVIDPGGAATTIDDLRNSGDGRGVRPARN